MKRLKIIPLTSALKQLKQMSTQVPIEPTIDEFKLHGQQSQILRLIKAYFEPLKEKTTVNTLQQMPQDLEVSKMSSQAKQLEIDQNFLI